MKKIFAFSLLSAFSVFTYAQSNLFPANGNVGIGTSQPRSTLELHDDVAALNISTGKHTEAMVDNEVIGSINFYKHYGISFSGAIKLLQAGGQSSYGPAHLAFYTNNTNNPYTASPLERMRITSSGDIGIGTSDTKGYKLAVAGNMIAESVKVKLQGAWPDFVFAKSYQLPTLKETEVHITEKGHLPGIPTAADVKENGIDLGEMNAKLLQKIEELTLHLIEQDKKINEMKQESDNQKIISDREIELIKSKLNKKLKQL